MTYGEKGSLVKKEELISDIWGKRGAPYGENGVSRAARKKKNSFLTYGGNEVRHMGKRGVCRRMTCGSASASASRSARSLRTSSIARRESASVPAVTTTASTPLRAALGEEESMRIIRMMCGKNGEVFFFLACGEERECE